eukprot:TRINITY_DN23890_c0_g1_i1.p1 TRINITY_DN23890_c0_g1~~TRINITY_DN23890_c0_g1_i1.p1  ORF type:complete len:413 (+),score=58.17 TRINITY_DN23890_c0_g1_i1:151-1389(+)
MLRSLVGSEMCIRDRSSTVMDASCAGLSTLTVECLTRPFEFRPLHEIAMPGWDRAFKAVIELIQENSRSCPQRERNVFAHGSFAPPRENAAVEWYVDGKDTFGAVAAAIESATEQVLIADWMLSPEVLLRRPEPETLAQLLLRKCEKDNIDVWVLLYNEVEMALPNNSRHASELLTGLHANIRVLRHPGADMVKWSHHEKLVIVDQMVAFIGGLDLALGRCERTRCPVPETAPCVKIWPGKDFYNPLFQEFFEVQLADQDPPLIDRRAQPRMPWHDVAFSVTGLAARDAALHFVQRWNNHVRSALVSVQGHGTENDAPILQGKRAQKVCCLGRARSYGQDRLVMSAPSYSTRYSRQGKLSPNQHVVDCQVLRSGGQWSIGLDFWLSEERTTERSICNAYMAEITASEHYICA